MEQQEKKTGHTPGPWEVFTLPAAWTDKMVPVVRAGTTVAVAYVNDPPSAPLVAAAPALAAALQALLPWAERNHDALKCDCAGCEAAGDARAALRAAGFEP